MELYDSEESCSSVSSSSYVFSASLDSQESSVDSYPRLPSKTVKKSRKRTPHILDKLYYREVGFIASVVNFVVDFVFLSEFGDVIRVRVGCVGGYLNLSSTGSMQLNFEQVFRIRQIMIALVLQIRGNFASLPHAANSKLFCQIPAHCQIRLRNVLPDSALDSKWVKVYFVGHIGSE